MKTINNLQIKSSSRYEENDPTQDGNKNTKFTDLIIDGKSLYQALRKYDMVPSLGWGSEENQRNMIDYFLLRQLHTYLFYRYPILVCPLCGDEECGFISVFIEREEDLVIWKDFKREPDGVQINIGPFYFKWEEYESAINETFRIAGTQ